VAWVKNWRPGGVRVFDGKTTAPGVTDDVNAGYLVGDNWIDETADASYQCQDITAGAAVWAQIDGGGGGSGTMTTVKEGGVQLGGADIVTLDFDDGDFDLTESPDTEVNIVLNAGGHNIADHGDTSATGTELGTLTDGSDSDTLHTHGAFLTVDQTTPQEIINGFPCYEDTHSAFTDQHCLIDKEYVDAAVVQIGARFYMLDAADGTVGTYKQCSISASALSIASVNASANAETDTLIEEWISPTGMTWTSLETGVYDLNVFAAKTAGNRDVRIFWRFYERKADTSEVLIATSNLSDLITTKARIRAYATLSTIYTPDVDSRLVGKVYFNTDGGSQNTTCVLYYQGDEDSHWQIPVSHDFLDDTYVAIDEFTTNGGVLVASGAGTFAEETGDTLRTSLGLAIGTNVLAEQTIGIADNNLVEMDDAGPANVGEYVRLTANGLEGRTDAEVKEDLDLEIGTDILAQQTIGIADDNLLEVDGSPNDNEYAKFTAAGLEGRTYANVLTDIGVTSGANVTGDNAPQAHQASHSPNDGGDALDCAAPANIDGVQAAAEGTADTLARADHVHRIQHSISDNTIMTVDGTMADNDFVKVTADGYEGRNYQEATTDLFSNVLAENTQILFDPALSADGKWNGISRTGTAGAILAFGDTVYFAVGDSKWELLDADAEATISGLAGICVVAGNEDAAVTIMTYGVIRADTAFPALTIGAPVFAGTTAGDIVVTAPSGSSDCVRVLGQAITANSILFNPSPDWYELVA